MSSLSSCNKEDLEIRINLLNSTKQNQEFIKLLKNVLEDHKLFDLATAEKRIFKNVIPLIINRFSTVYNDNISLFETLDDEIMRVLIKENLEVAFELTESLQEILNFMYQQNPLNAGDIESVLKYVPNCVLLFADHWNNSSEAYKRTFNEEITKLLEVIKYLYVSFLHLVEMSVNISDNDESFLVNTLISICELTKNLYFNLDESGGLVISSWKCFGTVAAKYSTALETSMDLRIPITALCEDVYKVLVTIINQDIEAVSRHLKMIQYLIKILFKITDIFYQYLNTFGLDLLVFLVKISSFHLKKFEHLSAEALTALDTEVFKSLDFFLQHLIMGQSDFKDHLEKISDYVETNEVLKQHPMGIINLLTKILYVVATVRSDWCITTTQLIEVMFVILRNNKELCSDRCTDELYQELILNTSAAILLQDVSFQSSEILLQHILQDDAFVAVLALDIYTLVISNVHPDESITLFINLLYGVNDILCGFFTSRPEIVYLKKLLQRMFKILPDSLKEEIIKLFNPEHSIQIWRFLGFSSLPAHVVQLITNPVVSNTSDCIRAILDNCTEDMPLNIAEGLELISTVKDLDIKDERLVEITKFLDALWASDFNVEVIENNIFKYFIMRITEVTARFMQNSMLDLHVISTNLKTLSCKESYWVAIYKIILSILNALPTISIPEINKQELLTQVAAIINHTIQNKGNLLLQETYLELFRNLNGSHKDILNCLLDSLNPKVASQIFQYLEKCSTGPPLITNICKSCFNHKCLNWKMSIDTTILPQIKRAKLEVPISKPVKTLSIENVFPSQIPNKIRKTIHSTEKTKEQGKDIGTFNSNEAEDDSSATEVIERIKGEVKCLLKICKTEKLTQKNVSHLRTIMSQVSSLM